ncbi:MAG: 16S rRNA (guanine(527)-N(7))-methyltransferase RsmG [Elusimicrobia bacterium]|nr:MAG: 16S rRNA (guanine(527)-N(7))-methyltransferase RsmG [Elusimicrobiota bacterium]
MITKALKREGKETLAQWGVRLDDEAWEKLDAYGAAVLEFNKKTNLTAAKTPEEIVNRHLLDSLAPLAAWEGQSPNSILDVGSGGGFVGVCLKIALPNARVTLLESVYRKIGFLNWTTARLALKGIDVRHARAIEDTGAWAPLGSGGAQGPEETPAPFDLVTARALAPLDRARRLTEPFVKQGGIAMIFQSDPIEGSFAYRLPGEEKDRHLARFAKEKETL